MNPFFSARKTKYCILCVCILYGNVRSAVHNTVCKSFTNSWCRYLFYLKNRGKSCKRLNLAKLKLHWKQWWGWAWLMVLRGEVGEAWGAQQTPRSWGPLESGGPSSECPVPVSAFGHTWCREGAVTESFERGGFSVSLSDVFPGLWPDTFLLKLSQ